VNAIECVLDDEYLCTYQGQSVQPVATHTVQSLRVSGDGLILSSATGSTAYSMAAGGSIVHPSIKCMLLERGHLAALPVCRNTDVPKPDWSMCEACSGLLGGYESPLVPCLPLNTSPISRCIERLRLRLRLRRTVRYGTVRCGTCRRLIVEFAAKQKPDVIDQRPTVLSLTALGRRRCAR